MTKPPESTKTSLRQKLAARAAERWPQLAGVDVRRFGFHLGIRDLPGQPRRLRAISPAQRLASRHPAGRPRLSLRPLPRRPHRMAQPAPRRINRRTPLGRSLAEVDASRPDFNRRIAG